MRLKHFLSKADRKAFQIFFNKMPAEFEIHKADRKALKPIFRLKILNKIVIRAEQRQEIL